MLYVRMNLDQKLHSGTLFAKFTLMYIHTKYISMNFGWSNCYYNQLNVNFQKAQITGPVFGSRKEQSTWFTGRCTLLCNLFKG